MKKNGTWILGANLLLLLFIFLVSFGGKNGFKTLEVEKLILKSPNGTASMILGFNGDVPEITMNDSLGNSVMEIAGGDSPKILFKSQKQTTFKVAQEKNLTSLTLSDGSGADKITMKSGSMPGIFLKNAANKTIGTWTVLSDGGCGLGLADRNGSAASILRGGTSPSVSFFSAQNEPMAALGMIQKVPHLLISGPVGNEGILIHGGNQSSMVFVDEGGKVKILISKNGVFQGKTEGPPKQKKRENKVFSFEDQEVLFPESILDEDKIR